MKGKIILSLAMSLDGYIVDDEDKYDWIVGDGDSHLNTKGESDIKDIQTRFDVIVMGYKSYKEFGDQSMFNGKRLIVATRKNITEKTNTTFVGDDLIETVLRYKEDGKTIWLFGGSMLTDNFIKRDVIDNYEVGIVPMIIGNGKRLFLDDNPRIKLHLDSYSIHEGITILKYSRR